MSLRYMYNIIIIFTSFIFLICSMETNYLIYQISSVLLIWILNKGNSISFWVDKFGLTVLYFIIFGCCLDSSNGFAYSLVLFVIAFMLKIMKENILDNEKQSFKRFTKNPLGFIIAKSKFEKEKIKESIKDNIEYFESEE